MTKLYIKENLQMNKEKKYFRQQKAYGAVVISIASVFVAISIKLLIPALVLTAIGLNAIMTKEKVFLNSYFFETYEDEEEEI